MTEEKQVVPVIQEVEGFASRDLVIALGKRVKTLLPAAKDLSDEGAYALAQYSLSTDANPWRGEIYAWEDWQGKLFLDEGYKLLVRWAKRQCDYVERYTPTKEGCNEGDIGFVCQVMRTDHVPMMQAFVQMKIPPMEAYELASTSSIGIVRKEEMFCQKDIKGKGGKIWKHKGDPIEPPKGWSWEKVARKRALKNCLNLSHGAPSPKEIAAESWKVGQVETKAEDWQDVKPGMSVAEKEAVATYNAQQRQHQEQVENGDFEDVSAQQAIDEVFEL